MATSNVAWCRWLAAALFCAQAFIAFPLLAANAYLLRPDRVWDGNDDGAHAGWVVLVRDGAVAAVGPATELALAPDDPRRRVRPVPFRQL